MEDERSKGGKTAANGQEEEDVCGVSESEQPWTKGEICGCLNEIYFATGVSPGTVCFREGLVKLAVIMI